MASEITYDCGHVEIEGGNLADPTAIVARQAGLMTFIKSGGLCTMCREPEKYGSILNWKEKGNTDGIQST